MPWNAVHGVRKFTPKKTRCSVFGKGTYGQFLVWNKSALCEHYLLWTLYRVSCFKFLDLPQRLPRNKSDCVRKIAQEQTIKSDSSFRTKHEHKLQIGKPTKANSH